MPPLLQHYILKQYHSATPQYQDTATLLRHNGAPQQTMHIFRELVLSASLTHTRAVQRVISTILFPTASENLITLFCFNTVWKKFTFWISLQLSTKTTLQNEYAQELFASLQKLLFLNLLTGMKQNHLAVHKSFWNTHRTILQRKI